MQQDYMDGSLCLWLKRDCDNSKDIFDCSPEIKRSTSNEAYSSIRNYNNTIPRAIKRLLATLRNLLLAAIKTVLTPASPRRFNTVWTKLYYVA